MSCDDNTIMHKLINKLRKYYYDNLLRANVATNKL